MEYEVRCSLEWQVGAFEVIADGAHLVATEPGDVEDEVVIAFKAESEYATVQLIGPGMKTVWTATPVAK